MPPGLFHLQYHLRTTFFCLLCKIDASLPNFVRFLELDIYAF